LEETSEQNIIIYMPLCALLLEKPHGGKLVRGIEVRKCLGVNIFQDVPLEKLLASWGFIPRFLVSSYNPKTLNNLLFFGNRKCIGSNGKSV
jgi:hypothetical protein